MVFWSQTLGPFFGVSWPISDHLLLSAVSLSSPGTIILYRLIMNLRVLNPPIPFQSFIFIKSVLLLDCLSYLKFKNSMTKCASKFIPNFKKNDPYPARARLNLFLEHCGNAQLITSCHKHCFNWNIVGMRNSLLLVTNTVSTKFYKNPAIICFERIKNISISFFTENQVRQKVMVFNRNSKNLQLAIP